MRIKTLRPFQDEAVASGVELFTAAKKMLDVADAGGDAVGRRRVIGHNGYLLIEAPTGSGKTLMAGCILERFAGVENVVWFWFAPFKGVVNQTEAFLREQFSGLRLLDLAVDRTSEGVRSGDTFVTTWQTVATRVKDKRNVRKETELNPSIDRFFLTSHPIGNTKFEDFTDIVKSFFVPSLEKEKLVECATKHIVGMNLAQRLMTGQAAEAYFKINYSSIDAFKHYTVDDVTSYGCGYDFHLSNQTEFYCVEVKGIGTNRGAILMTEKEYALAEKLQERYCLFVVRDFQKTPFHSLFFNPLHSRLIFTPQPKTIISYSMYITEAS